MGVSENSGAPYFGVLIIRILLFRVLYEGPLFSETPSKVVRAQGLLATPFRAHTHTRKFCLQVLNP